MSSLPGDPGYDAARRCYNALVARRPAVIARCVGTGDTAASVEPWSVSGGYVNYMQADEPIERVRAAFGDEASERLQGLKRRYDPDNVMHRNQNIPPR